MKLTKKRTIELHKELWDWLSKHPNAEKYQWPKWKNFPYISHDCFLCAYAREQQLNTNSFASKCYFCIAKDGWGYDALCNHCEDVYSIFTLWKRSDHFPKLKREFAKLIRDVCDK